MSFPFTKQPDAMDCGPACLCMIAEHYGKQYAFGAFALQLFYRAGRRVDAGDQQSSRENRFSYGRRKAHVR